MEKYIEIAKVQGIEEALAKVQDDYEEDKVTTRQLWAFFDYAKDVYGAEAECRL